VLIILAAPADKNRPQFVIPNMLKDYVNKEFIKFFLYINHIRDKRLQIFKMTILSEQSCFESCTTTHSNYKPEAAIR
jgi:hypothetical protein